MRACTVPSDQYFCKIALERELDPREHGRQLYGDASGTPSLLKLQWLNVESRV